MNKKTTLDMTEGKVIRVLLVFTIPIFISNLFQQFYNVVDVAVIGHILGDNALAAVGATSSIYSLVIGFINGMSNGFCMIIARYFGGNDQDNFQKSVRFSIILSFATTVVLTIASLLVLKPLLRLLHTPVDILDLSQSYISVIMLFCCVTFAYNLLSSMLRAIGNSYIPLYALVIASVLNVILASADRADAGRTRPERQDYPGTENAARRIADLEREVKQREQNREHSSLKERLEENKRIVAERERENARCRNHDRGMSR